MTLGMGPKSTGAPNGGAPNTIMPTVSIGPEAADMFDQILTILCRDPFAALGHGHVTRAFI